MIYREEKKVNTVYPSKWNMLILNDVVIHWGKRLSKATWLLEIAKTQQEPQSSRNNCFSHSRFGPLFYAELF